LTAEEGVEITVRVATAADVDALARLRWQMTDEEGDVREPLVDFERRFREAVERFEDSGTWTVWVADAGDGIVGCLWLKRIERVPRPNRDALTMGYVTNVYVEPGWRNRGIGSGLLAAVREVAERERLAELFVWPSERAVTLYRRAGYVPSRELHELELIPDL
jgi:GNAT superfamily N-acetyltransferase